MSLRSGVGGLGAVQDFAPGWVAEVVAGAARARVSQDGSPTPRLRLLLEQRQLLLPDLKHRTKIRAVNGMRLMTQTSRGI